MLVGGLRLRLHGIGYVQIRLGSDLLWYGSTLFTRDQICSDPFGIGSTMVRIHFVYTGSDMFRSVWDRIHCGTDPLCLHGTGSKLERYGSI